MKKTEEERKIAKNQSAKKWNFLKCQKPPKISKNPKIYP